MLKFLCLFFLRWREKLARKREQIFLQKYRASEKTFTKSRAVLLRLWSEKRCLVQKLEFLDKDSDVSTYEQLETKLKNTEQLILRARNIFSGARADLKTEKSNYLSAKAKCLELAQKIQSLKKNG